VHLVVQAQPGCLAPLVALDPQVCSETRDFRDPSDHLVMPGQLVLLEFQVLAVQLEVLVLPEIREYREAMDSRVLWVALVSQDRVVVKETRVHLVEPVELVVKGLPVTLD